MSLVTPTPVPDPSRPIPSTSSLGTWPADMEEMHRWMREDLAPGALLLASQALENAQFAQTQADLAAGLASFKGPWASLSGALNMPASVSHVNKLWVLTANLANVATATPGVSASWVEFRADAFGVAYGASNVGTTLDTLTASVAERIQRIGGATGAARIPGGTSAQRPADGVRAIGDVRWSTESKRLEVWSDAKPIPAWLDTGARREEITLDYYAAVAVSQEFTLASYPWVREIDIRFKDVELNGAGDIHLQFHDGTTWTPTIFESASAGATAASTALLESTNSICLRVNSTGRKVNGRLNLARYGILPNTPWVSNHTVKAGPTVTMGGGVCRPVSNLLGFRLQTPAGFLGAGSFYLTLIG